MVTMNCVLSKTGSNPSVYASLASGTLPGQVNPGVNPADVSLLTCKLSNVIYRWNEYIADNYIARCMAMLEGFGAPPLCTAPNSPEGW
jgi:hypothetical protein